MSLNDSMSDIERAKLAVWDYPVSDKYTKMFQAMKEAGFPADIDEALKRIRREGQYANNEFAFIGDASSIKYLVMTNCDLLQVGEEFSRKPYAIAVQQGSSLKDQFNNAYVRKNVYLFLPKNQILLNRSFFLSQDSHTVEQEKIGEIEG